MSHLLRHAEDTYDAYRAEDFPRRRFSPATLHDVLRRLVAASDGLLSMERAGESFEGRPVSLVRLGSGPVKILLWSQMHGDESTATMAIVDILRYAMLHRASPDVQKLLSGVSMFFLPMLNPDGAERFQRRTSQGIDMNRDAMALLTPEARILRDTQASLKPAFGFNLHDQELSTVAQSKNLSTIALLAPAYDAAKSDNDVRLRAKRVAAVFAAMLEERIPGRIARYDDSFEPRAFGDNMQLWGTSTVLVESGHALNDPEKDSVRKLNALGILHCCDAIAGGAYQAEDTARYDNLPFNGKRAYDIIIRNVMLDYGRGRTLPADLGISYQVDTHSESTPKLADLGDLRPFIGLTEIDAKETRLAGGNLTVGAPFLWEEYFRKG
jgi:hypothetical protein